MRLQTDTRGEVMIVTVSGELNVDSAGRLNDAVNAALGEQQRDFVVDLAQITTVDSAGLEALTALQRRCEEELGMVRFCGADDTLLKIFEITRLNRQLALHKDVEEALRGLAST